MTEKPSVVGRKSAHSTNISFTEPIVIRGGSGTTTRFELLLQYVRRSGGDRLAPKFLYWKKKTGSFRAGYPVEFTLTHEEAEHLRNVLAQGLKIADLSSDGNFLVIPLDNVASTNLGGRDPAMVGQALASLLTSQDVLGSISADPRGIEVLHRLELAVRLTELESAAAKLESNLNEGVVSEEAYQAWCKNHGWAFGNTYTTTDSVREIALGDKVDILLNSVTSGLRDIIELKRPDMEVLSYDKTHKNWYWSSDASKAIGQCHRYLDALHEAAGNGLRDHPELVAYHPSATIVLGRSNTWEEEKIRALHGLNFRLHSIRIMTYDHLLAQARNFLKQLDKNAYKAGK
ncbi:MAG TPA: Shedu anti-phage system protein SduA domain-containing protein [Candidatus Saccharimonadales bacterium]|nr:Shedu anti-phage system protein SduA domain-containing protein [Candidatus Saccharimonadales bacterium]